MTEKQIDNLFWDCCHYGKIIKVEDFTFENEEIYISIAVIEYEGKKHLFIKRNGVVVHYEEVKED
jgi:hypothetical protein